MRYLQIRSRHNTHSVLRKNPNLTSTKRIIYRLGSTTELKRKYDLEINPIQAIKNSMDKKLMKECFDKAEIKHCTYWKGAEVLKARLKFPIIAKKRFGSRGRGNTKLNTQIEFDQFINTNRNKLKNYIFEEFFNSAREYRLHVNKHGCFYACRKLRISETPESERWFFNNSNCNWVTQYKYRNEITTQKDTKGYPIKKELFAEPTTWLKIENDCRRALIATGLDFGAFDVRVSKKGTWRIIEVNSAPSFGERTTHHYIKELKQIINVYNK